MDKLTLLIGGVVVAGAAVIFWNAGQDPGGGRSGSLAAPAASESGAPMVSVKVPDDLSALARTGEIAFNGNCAACHGENATGLDGAGPPLVHKIYEPSHHSDAAFFLAVQNGVRSHHWRFGSMAPVEGLTRADVKGIVAYVRELQRENGIN